MNVRPELLAAAAAQADTESQRIFARHSASDAAVETALFGWVGNSRAALADTAQRWAATTTALSGRIYRHGEALRVSALTFAQMDAEHARALSGSARP